MMFYKHTSFLLGLSFVHSCTSKTVFDCTKNSNIVINTDDYEVICTDGPYFNLTFGPRIKVVTRGIGCSWLTGVIFSDSVETIEEYSFYECNHLESVRFGAKLKTIGQYSFYNTVNLKSISIPDSVISIGNRAFQNTVGVVEMKLGSGIQSIGDYAFYACGMMNPLVFPNSVVSIGENAFTVSRAPSIVFNEGITHIGIGSFSSMTSLTRITMSNTIQSIDSYAFAELNSPSIVWGSGLISIGSHTFQNSFKTGGSLVLPDSLETIKDCAFACQCSNTVCDLNTITFGLNLVSIGKYAFGVVESSIPRSTHLQSVVFTGHKLRYIDDYAFVSANFESLTLPEGLIKIGEGSFQSNPYLLQVELPLTLTSIGRYAFQNSVSLTTIGIPDATIEIKEGAFDGCTALDCVFWNKELSRSVDENAFVGCPLRGCGESSPLEGKVLKIKAIVGSKPQNELLPSDDGFLMKSSSLSVNFVLGVVGCLWLFVAFSMGYYYYNNVNMLKMLSSVNKKEEESDEKV